LLECCASVTCGRGVKCRLVVMQKTSDNKSEVFKGGRYASTEEELFGKAIALLDKCKIAPRPSGEEKQQSSVRTV
jgi:hypothetical protein